MSDNNSGGIVDIIDAIEESLRKISRYSSRSTCVETSAKIKEQINESVLNVSDMKTRLLRMVLEK